MPFGVLVRQPVPKRHLSSKIFLPVEGGLVGLVRLPVIKICNGRTPVLPVQMGTVSWLEMVKINTNRLGARVWGTPHYIYLELPAWKVSD